MLSKTLEHIVTMDLGDIMASTFLVENGIYYFATTRRTIEIFESQVNAIVLYANSLKYVPSSLKKAKRN